MRHVRSRSNSPINKMTKADVQTKADVRKVSSRRSAVDVSKNIKTVQDLKKKMDNRKKKKNEEENDGEKMEDDGKNDKLNYNDDKKMELVDNSKESSQSKNASDSDDNDEKSEKGDDVKRQQATDGKQTNVSKNDVEASNCDKRQPECDKVKIDLDKYIDTDKGPYVVHMVEKRKSDKEIVQEIHDVVIGLKLKQLKVKGIREVKKISRKELKVIFTSKDMANEFLESEISEKIGVEAYIPDYNVYKVGIIFDIPTLYDEEYLRENLEAKVPIVGIQRCQKRKFVNGRKTNEWIPANTVKLTFRSQSVPDDVIFGYSGRKVKPDVPNVTQCYKCTRFGHIQRYCKQERHTCTRCGTQHDFSPDNPCTNGVRCFHCHSDQHGSTSKECPEFMRNKLIKESMFFKNITFTEANESFPKTQSQFRIAEKEAEFPDLSMRRKPMREERQEASFPRKTTQDLDKQYREYMQLNMGKKPVADSSVAGANKYSEVTKSQKMGPESRKKTTEGKESNWNEVRGRSSENKGRSVEESSRALEFIKDLSYKLGVARTDADQRPQTSITNDLMLIEIGRMVMDFLMTADRKVVDYSDEEQLDFTQEL